MMAIVAGARVTWKKGHPLKNPFPANHLIFDAVGTVVRFHPIFKHCVFVKWSCPITKPNDRTPIWLCRVEQLEEAVVR